MMNTKKHKLIRNLTSNFRFAIFAIMKLPSLFFWGVRVRSLNMESCSIALPYNWRSKNPFKSIYFSALLGAAELSTGLLVLLHLSDDNEWSFLVLETNARFVKKAKSTVVFSCEDGQKLQEKIANHDPRNGTKIVMKTVGIDQSGQIVAEVEIHWSIKKKHTK